MTRRPAFSKIIESIQKIFEQLPPLARSQTTINLAPIMKTSKERPKSKGRARASRKQATAATAAATVVADKELVEDEEDLDRQSLATPPSEPPSPHSGSNTLTSSPSGSTAEVSKSAEFPSDNTLEASSDHSGSLELSSSGSSPSKSKVRVPH